MKKNTLLKLTGLAALTMIALVIISILEVVIYSYLINPGHPKNVYETHANFSAPYVSGIGGFVIFLLVSRFWAKKGYENAFKLAVLFPTVYLVMDFVILLIAGTEWSGFIITYLLANGAKFLGSYLGYKLNYIKKEL